MRADIITTIKRKRWYAHAPARLFGTGEGLDIGVVDPNWTMSFDGQTYFPAVTVTPNAGGGENWLHGLTGYQWISTPTLTATSPFTYYRTTFYLPAYQATTISTTVLLIADSGVDYIWCNGFPNQSGAIPLLDYKTQVGFDLTGPGVNNYRGLKLDTYNELIFRCPNVNNFVGFNCTSWY